MKVPVKQGFLTQKKGYPQAEASAVGLILAGTPLDGALSTTGSAFFIFFQGYCSRCNHSQDIEYVYSLICNFSLKDKLPASLPLSREVRGGTLRERFTVLLHESCRSVNLAQYLLSLSPSHLLTLLGNNLIIIA
jgi:hypothetical protein